MANTNTGKIIPELDASTLASLRLYARPYKTYTAFITQSGTSNPGPVELENTIGEIVWTRVSGGTYLVTSTTGEFIEGSTSTLYSKTYLSGTGVTYLEAEWISTSQISVTTKDINLNLTDGLLSNRVFEIRVYVIIPSPTPSPTPTPSPSITPTVTPSISVSPSVTPSVTPSISISPSVTVSPTVTPSTSAAPSSQITLMKGNFGNANIDFTVTTDLAATYTVDWGDATEDTYASGVAASHTYAAGEFEIGITSSNDVQTFAIEATGSDQDITSAVFNTPNLIDLNSSFFGSGGKSSSFCPNLISVTLPSSMPSLTGMTNTFNGCDSLTGVTLPSSAPSLTTMSDTFSACISLTTSPTFPTTLPAISNISYIFGGCTNLVTATIPDVFSGVTIADSLFISCNNLTGVTLPSTLDSVTNVSGMFNGCTNLPTVTLPSTLDSVTDASDMFNNCDSFTTFTMPTSMNSSSLLLSGLFRNCDSLIDVTLPISMSGLTGLNVAFLDAPSLTGVTMNSAVSASVNFTNVFTANNTSLSYVDASGSTLSDTSLDSLFSYLPVNAVPTKTIDITGATGEGTADKTIATGRGWTVIPA